MLTRLSSGDGIVASKKHHVGAGQYPVHERASFVATAHELLGSVKGRCDASPESLLGGIQGAEDVFEGQRIADDQDVDVAGGAVRLLATEP
jgi:hypothetical protein